VSATFTSWTFSPALIVALLVTGLLYVRGWRRLRRRDHVHFGAWTSAAFLGGLACIFIAIASPLDALGYFLLVVHMLQHLLLMFAAPMLIWLGQPLLPLLMGLPAPVRRYWVGPYLRMRSTQRAFRWLVRPAPAWVIFVVAVWAWHLPALYDLALRSNFAHNLEHATFFYTGLLFWFPVFQPYPSNPHSSRWTMIPYLLLAGVQGTALSALLTFADRVIYPHYASMPRISQLSALDDQALAGVAMWIPGSIAYLVPLVWIGLRIMTGGRTLAAIHPGSNSASTELPPTRERAPYRRRRTRATAPDLLHVPVIRDFLRWRHARLVLQIALAALAAAIIADGLCGPRMAPMNLAGVVPWVLWRGFLIVTLLGLGNLFCMGCPFMLPRRLVKWWPTPRWRWPNVLRGKWVAVVLIGLFFWAYETFALWDHPAWTAWIALGYFAAAFLVDGLFRGAAFCKHICPIGQFNMVQSFLSPSAVTVRDSTVCHTCRTKDCLRGRGSLSGCELYLLQPRKGGNMDCTFCLDCIHACPHDNVGITARIPGRELVTDRARSGLGHMHGRPDLAALVLILVFGAFVNAAGMIAPVLAWRQKLTEVPGLEQAFTVTTLFIVVTLLLLPLLLVGGTAQLARRWSGVAQGVTATVCRFAYAFVPLGAGMWLAHYGFHLWTSAGTIIPVTQRVAGDLGLHFLGTPDWSLGVRTAGTNLLRFEIVSVQVGYLIALYVAVRLARGWSRTGNQALGLFVPWAALLTLLAVVGIWILFQPMAMRGTMEMIG
jgi:cytochrome c oxidase assembly factor CtaG/polyferredoxin